MRKRLATAVALVVSATALTTAGLPAFAQEEEPAPGPACQTGVTAIVKDIKAGYDHKFWRHGPNLDRLTAARQQAICLSASSRKKVQRTFKAERSSFRTYRSYRHIATIPGFHEGDEYLEWLPIPRYIVACETQGLAGQGRWRAHNPDSAAQGPAQLNGWHAPENASTEKQKLKYWKVTVYVRNIQGLAAWSCLT
jgi:hypothetical protein